MYEFWNLRFGFFRLRFDWLGCLKLAIKIPLLWVEQKASGKGAQWHLLNGLECSIQA